MSSAPPLPPFAAVLLAGGRSTRMGRDKAGLIFDGQPLWQLQLAKLRALSPAELFISGDREGPYANAGVEIVTDPTAGLGPLAGLAASLRRATSPLVLVLAIDMPALSVALLGAVVAEARARGGGVLPKRDGRFEPLAAVYPVAALALAQDHLQDVDRSLHRFGQRLIELQLASVFPISQAQHPEFANLNTPADLAWNQDQC